MNIARIILRVTDLERSVTFWSETVGLTKLFEGGPFVFLDGGGVQLVLNQVDGATPEPSQAEIVFESGEIMAVHDEMVSRGVPFEVDLRSVTSDGERDLLAAHFHDPDGHLASLTGWVATS